MIAKEEEEEEHTTKANGTAINTMTKTTEKMDTNNKEEEEEEEEETRAYDRTTTTTRKRHGARNQHRHKFFVKWIIEKFPDAVRQAKDDDSMQKNNNRRCHVLDIAGGKGELSARLIICHSLFVQMVDPRPANLYDCFYKNVYRSLPKKWQEKINHQDQSAMQQPTDKIQQTLDARFHQFVKSFPCDGGIDDDDDDDDDEDKNYGSGGGGCKIPSAVVQLQQDAELMQAVKNCTLMIGMHADGATEAIVDIALYYRKPFVVVPCCVFPNLFRHRMVPRIRRRKKVNHNNEDIHLEEDHQTPTSEPVEEMIPVRTHEQFCQYLAMKDSHFVMETLPFEGRNVGIWWDGMKRDGDERGGTW